MKPPGEQLEPWLGVSLGGVVPDIEQSPVWFLAKYCFQSNV